MPIVVTGTGREGDILNPCLNWKGYVADADQLPPTGNLPNDAYTVTGTNEVWVWNGAQWVNLGRMVGGIPGPAGTGFTPKGTVVDQASLPTSGNAVGDIYSDAATNHLWWWNGTQWVDMGKMADGPPGGPGPAGLNAWTISEDVFTVPPVGQSATMTVEDAHWIAVGMWVWVEGANGPNEAGCLKVTAKNGNVITLENITGGAGGGAVNIPNLVSADAGNAIVVGSDGKLQVTDAWVYRAGDTMAGTLTFDFNPGGVWLTAIKIGPDAVLANGQRSSWINFHDRTNCGCMLNFQNYGDGSGNFTIAAWSYTANNAFLDIGWDAGQGRRVRFRCPSDTDMRSDMQVTGSPYERPQSIVLTNFGQALWRFDGMETGGQWHPDNPTGYYNSAWMVWYNQTAYHPTGSNTIGVPPDVDTANWEVVPAQAIIPGQLLWFYGRWTRNHIYYNDRSKGVGIVQGSDGKLYRSITNNNLGNDPTASPANWQQISV